MLIGVTVVQLHLLVVLLCALYGSVFTIGKMALETTTPLFITGSRMVLAALLLLTYQFFFHRKELALKKEHIFPIVMIGLTSVYFTNFLEFWGLQFMESGKACFLYSFSPIASALLSVAWFSEKITFWKWIGLVLGLLGFAPLLMLDPAVTDNSSTVGFFTLAELALLGAAVAVAMGWIIMRSLIKKHTISFVTANGVSMMVGGLVSLLHSFFVDSWNPLPITDTIAFIPPFLGLTLVSNLISYNLNAFLLKHYTATFLSFAGISQSLFAAFFGFIFLEEVLSGYFWISIVMVSFGLYIYYQQELKQGLTPAVARSRQSNIHSAHSASSR